MKTAKIITVYTEHHYTDILGQTAVSFSLMPFNDVARLFSL